MSSEYFITRNCPEGFFPSVVASGCCLEFENKLLLLKRHPDKPQGSTWGVPGGKIEEGESIRDCVIREIQEEAGLDINDDGLKQIGSLFCRIPNGNRPLNYVFHLFLKTFTAFPELNIGLNEHVEAKWCTLEEALALELIVGGKEVLDYYKDATCLK